MNIFAALSPQKGKKAIYKAEKYFRYSNNAQQLFLFKAAFRYYRVANNFCAQDSVIFFAARVCWLTPLLMSPDHDFDFFLEMTEFERRVLP
jgi:hypothetical protein